MYREIFFFEGVPPYINISIHLKKTYIISQEVFTNDMNYLSEKVIIMLKEVSSININSFEEDLIKRILFVII